MMTLDEAIKHAEEKACGNTECAEEYKQLAKWLRELKVLREYKEDRLMWQRALEQRFKL